MICLIIAMIFFLFVSGECNRLSVYLYTHQQKGISIDDVVTRQSLVIYELNVILSLNIINFV